MRGLLVKDFYMIRSVVIMMTGVFLVIGAGLSYLVSPQVLLILATVMTGMVEASTINMDKTCPFKRGVSGFRGEDGQQQIFDVSVSQCIRAFGWNGMFSDSPYGDRNFRL